MKAELMSPFLAQANGEVGWASTVVALALLLFIGAIMAVSIKKYQTVDDALKICGVLSGILGVVVGSFGTYFFTREAVASKVAMVETQSQQRIAEAQRGADVQLEKRIAEVQKDADTRLEQRVAEVQKGANAQLEQRIAEVRKDADTQLEQRLDEVQKKADIKLINTYRVLAQVATNLDARSQRTLMLMLPKEMHAEENVP